MEAVLAGCVLDELPERLIGDKAYDSDALDEQMSQYGIEMIAPNRSGDVKPNQTFFAQGDPADSVFYLQSGRAKLTVVSHGGKEATVTLLSAGDFVGEESLAAVPGLRLEPLPRPLLFAGKIGRRQVRRGFVPILRNLFRVRGVLLASSR